MARHVVARVDELPEGGRLIVTVKGHSIGLFNVDGRLYGLLNRCPHQGAELCRGSVLGQIDSDGPGDYRLDESRPFVVCPWHGWEFDLATGRSYFDPRRTRVRPYPVEVAGGAAVAGRREGPYVADVVDVSVDDDYVVGALPG
jgi:3-phenylpropionate/trans-cinnamate dioxygenase ferredoxin subunit